VTELRLGKKPAAPRPTDFKFAEFAGAIKLPTVPSRFGHGTAYANWEMLGNDRYGDCVWAGAAHEHMLFNKVVSGHDVPFDDDAVLADYAAATGFDRNDPSTDNGTDVHQALDYRRKIGIADTNGTRHKIGAYVSLDPKDWQHSSKPRISSAPSASASSSLSRPWISSTRASPGITSQAHR
jgi:hypothetical protein